MAKIIGIRKVVSELKNTPHGFHQEVWGWQDEAGNIQLYTSEYLSQNSWTVNHDEGEYEISRLMYAIMDLDNVSMTEAIRRAVAEIWGGE